MKYSVLCIFGLRLFIQGLLIQNHPASSNASRVTVFEAANFGFKCITYPELCVFFTRSEGPPHHRHVYVGSLYVSHVASSLDRQDRRGVGVLLPSSAPRAASAGLGWRNFICWICRSDWVVIRNTRNAPITLNVNYFQFWTSQSLYF